MIKLPSFLTQENAMDATFDDYSDNTKQKLLDLHLKTGNGELSFMMTVRQMTISKLSQNERDIIFAEYLLMDSEKDDLVHLDADLDVDELETKVKKKKKEKEKETLNVEVLIG